MATFTEAYLYHFESPDIADCLNVLDEMGGLDCVHVNHLSQLLTINFGFN